MDTIYYVAVALFIVAVLYASIGHGGASGYIAIMVLFGVTTTFIKPTALILNLFVSGISFFAFYKANYFKWRLLWPFIITSIPMAFIGAQIKVDNFYYNLVLGVFLLISIVHILFRFTHSTYEKKPIPLFLALAIGGGLGLLSGMIGIGGGIVLSPLLILFKWSSLKEAAAVSAPFIFLNSLSGLIGLAAVGFVPNPHIVLWVTITVMGGAIGSYLGSVKIPIYGLRYILAFVLAFAMLKLIIV